MLEDAGPNPGAGRPPAPTAADRQARPAAGSDRGGALRRGGLLLALGTAVLVIIVVGVGLGLTRGGGIGARSSPAGFPPPPALAPRPATADFAPVQANGQPPADVMNALVVPTGSTATGTTNYDRGSGPYDRGVSFASSASYDQLLNFFRFELAANHWSSKTEAPARGGPGRQVLAQHKSNDGFYWEVGVTVRRAPAQPTGSVTANQFDIRLLQNVEG